MTVYTDHIIQCRAEAVKVKFW